MNMTKRTLIALAALAVALTLHPVARAADETNASTTSPLDPQGALRERMQGIAKELNLTADQKEKLQTIVRDHAQKLRELHQDTSLSITQKREKFQAIREDITAEVKKVLTPDQFEKWKSKQSQLTDSGKRPMERIQEAIQDLNLTDTQKEQLRPLYEEQMQKLRDLRQDTSLSITEKLDKLKDISKEAAPKLKKVLNAEQYTKWEKNVNQWIDDLKQRFQQDK
jgi:Spy/CpxP family protein refolding chaperone